MIPNTRGKKRKVLLLWGKNYGTAYGIQAQGSNRSRKESPHTQKLGSSPSETQFFSTYPLCAISILVFVLAEYR